MQETELREYVEKAKQSLYFSGARIDADLGRFIDDQGEACIALGKGHQGRSGHLFLVGSGGSLASMQTAKYLLDSVLADVASDALPSYELIWRQPRRLDEDALVFLASYSGETEDTVAALRFAKAHGAKTIAIVGKPDSTMAAEADVVLPYDSAAIYEIPIAALLLYGVGRAGADDSASDLERLQASLIGLPVVLKRVLGAEEERAEQRARELLRAQHVYVLGSGPMAPLAYKVAMSVVMENIRIGATYCEAAEWRHGPAEALERLRATFLVLLGTDASRDLTSRTIDFCSTQGSEVYVYDAAEFGEMHPLLTPLVMNSVTQWLIVYSAILRGITDLDERVFMGHSVLATGGAQWP